MKITHKRPALFEKTDNDIWTDPYIRQQMLKEHLNPLSDAASRRKESMIKITDFISVNTKQQTRLLDLGCGPGLYTSFFQDKGYFVTGIDLNKVSIEYARKQHKDIQYIEGDYIKNYPDGKFDAVIMIYCDLGTHSDTHRDKLLRNIYESLEEEGVFIFDVFTEALTNDQEEGRNWHYQPDGGFWHANEYLLLSETFHYPESRAFAYQYHLLIKGEQEHFIVWDRYYTQEEITGILKETGFSEVTIHHHILTDNNFTSNSEMFVVAKK
ncbi:MAG: class I SAM-dependent methyltransferase [Bacteroidales bacterium]|jgi:SAM-dependent methyltransferase|nr:class I SAM-dependent methyltransferase [Bacteroidales bacterium]